MTAQRQYASPNHTASPTPAAAGTSSPGTSTAPTGAPSASTDYSPALLLAPDSRPARPPDIDLDGYVSSNVSVAPYRYPARVTIGVPADSAADHVPPTIGVIEPIDAESCLLHTGSNSLDELAIYLALFDLPIRIDEPPELIARVRELTARLSAAVE